MKRYIRCMGKLDPAHIVPKHATYSPTVDLTNFKSLLLFAKVTDNQILADEMVNVIISDIGADNAAGNVDNECIRKYYHKYYDAAVRSGACSSEMLSSLFNLV